MAEFRMPSLGADMEAGTLVEWHVTPGARVKRGDVVALVETQKGIVEIEIWETGIVTEILVSPGAKVPVGTVLATVGEQVEPAPSAPATPSAPARTAPATRLANGPAALAAAASSEHSVRAPAVRASPAARQLARERGVDLATLHGTGPHGAVTRGDVDKAIPTPAPPRAASAHASMRAAIASAMARSKREIPHYYLGLDIDVSRAAHWLELENARRPVTERVLFAALLVKATALALREFSDFNGFFVDGAFRPGQGIHVGVAIALRQGGLVAPAIHDTDEKNVTEIMSSIQDLVTRVRSGALRSSEMSDPTITVTSLGDQGTDSVFGVIYPPQVALVGFGAMRDRPWAESGMLAVRPVVTASLAADHRASDGHRGARFLAAIRRHLDAPEKL